MTKKMLATKFDVLEFIMKRELVWAYELVEHFGYSHIVAEPSRGFVA